MTDNNSSQQAIPVAPKPPSTLDKIIESLRSNLLQWVVTALITLLTVFSGYFTENVRLSINRADQRIKQYEDLTKELNKFVFSAELCVDMIENNWTRKETLIDWNKDYNSAITTLRQNEYVYRAWLNKYWSSNNVNEFNKVMTVIVSFDNEYRRLNNEIENVLYDEQKKINERSAKEASEKLNPIKNNLVEVTKAFILSLEM
ncbi:MAG: hypothetical protein IV101_13340 [Dechloromonas sp.]|uniref:hypothetical protein n=1 Tax=Dechloromonas sp. TaxID=1917218 RepID=UPI0027F3BE30|nr:hypothetical protein [Dechloromonas sp.]MBT9521863.1 hypothetical protein [Dechloromonas sp.]